VAEFFPRRHDRSHRPGLALFVNAGDPPLAVLADVVRMLDDAGVDCLELAVPFPDSVTDGPVIRRSADRALVAGVGLDETLAFVASVRGELRHLRIALFADWSHTVKPLSLRTTIGRVADAGADGLLVHALPPRVRPAYHRAAQEADLPVVTTCYAGSDGEVMAEAAAHASAYLYLVAHYGRSGTGPAGGFGHLAGAVARLRQATTAPIAVGFGVRTRDDVARVHDLGADAAIVGTAAVSVVERAAAERRDVVADMRVFVGELTGDPRDLDPTHDNVHLSLPGSHR
jgi:tryptophan synthase alpha chain